jgi:FtsP/CotA-like multicopper oxidase with cupredoxin domain
VFGFVVKSIFNSNTFRLQEKKKKRMWLKWFGIVALWAVTKSSELIQPDRLVLSKHTTVLTVSSCTWSIDSELINFQTRCYCYEWNGAQKCTVPGPTIVFTNGTDGFIRLANNLKGAGTFENGGHLILEDLISHDPDVTNLHTHGLHVDPAIDDVVDRLVQPGDPPIDYNFTILPVHYPGTHWYHGHWHGTVTFQVHTGLFGAMLVERSDNVGLNPVFANMTERVVILHGLSLNNASLTSTGECNCTGYTDWFDGSGTNAVKNPLEELSFHLTTICDQWCDMYCYQRNQSGTPPIQTHASANWQSQLAKSSIVNWDGGITLFMVNGQVRPTITVGKGEWIRLRIVNADAQASFILHFNSSSACQYYYIAADGVFFDTTRDISKNPYQYYLYMSMAGRGEVIMKCDIPGNYAVCSWISQTK